MKVFITRIISESGIQLLSEAGIEVEMWQEKRNLTPQEFISHCKKADALLNAGPNRMDANFLHECSHLKVIALHAVGYDNVDIETATKLKIPIGNTPGVVDDATADIAFLLMLAVSRKAFYHHKKIINNQWNFFEPTVDLGQEISGKTLGVFGLGNIGYKMAKKCIGAYDMKVIYHNRNRNEKAENELHAKYVSFEELLQQSDVLTLHANLTPHTRGIFNKVAFEKMKPGSIFINTARGSMHNEPDLIYALQQQIIWGAGLDVSSPEPMHHDNPLLQMQNVAVLPHIGTATFETREAIVKLAAQNIIAGLRGLPLPHIVNPEIYL
ncbi:MAG: D-glycerate dehydrogenase [Bacteroidetes bacterium]|nr:D-glycerate dehydrogenase [Bacteroidota bacterium]MBS1756805.1 D-glycerate dehydrogenase [Bacteroidota bacterium]